MTLCIRRRTLDIYLNFIHRNDSQNPYPKIETVLTMKTKKKANIKILNEMKWNEILIVYTISQWLYRVECQIQKQNNTTRSKAEKKTESKMTFLHNNNKIQWRISWYEIMNESFAICLLRQRSIYIYKCMSTLWYRQWPFSTSISISFFVRPALVIASIKRETTLEYDFTAM